MRAIMSFAVLLLCTFAACAGEPAATEETKAQVEPLVKKLASEKYEERKTASAALLDLGPSVYNTVNRARAETKDTEVRTQLDIVLLHWPAPRKPVTEDRLKKEKGEAIFKECVTDMVAEYRRLKALSEYLNLRFPAFNQPTNYGQIYSDMVCLEFAFPNMHDVIKNFPPIKVSEEPGKETSITMEGLFRICAEGAASSRELNEQVRVAGKIEAEWEKVRAEIDKAQKGDKSNNALKASADNLDLYLRFLKGKKVPFQDRVRFETISMEFTRANLEDILNTMALQTGLSIDLNSGGAEEAIRAEEIDLNAEDKSVADVLKEVLEPHGLTYKLVPVEKPTTIQICKK